MEQQRDRRAELAEEARALAHRLGHLLAPGEIQGRCRGDTREMQGRCRGDIREIQSVLVHLLAALRLDLGGAEVDGPLEERRAQLGGDDVGQGPREHDRGEADDEDGDPVVLVPAEPSAATAQP